MVILMVFAYSIDDLLARSSAWSVDDSGLEIFVFDMLL